VIDAPCGLPNVENLYRQYRLSLEQWFAMGEEQGWACPCGKPFTLGNPPVVDEEHEPPYRIRGLLCFQCNRRVENWMQRYITDPPAVRAIGPHVVPESVRNRKDRFAQRKKVKRAAQLSTARRRKPLPVAEPQPASTPIDEKLRRIV
jgi:hypothetical protein